MHRIMKHWLTVAACALLMAPCATAALRAPYTFPISDPYDATVIGTPGHWRAQLPEKIPARTMVLPANGKVPDIFWYSNGLEFSAALQDHPAPLLFNIAGTGASYQSAKMIDLQKALYQAGFHVINLSSPTYLDFQLAASTSHMPGYAPDDARDLYRVMQQVHDKIKDKADITGFSLVGYSLGALHAAFIADMDRSEKRFNFSKVYMINPPVNLYQSARILDKLTADNIPARNGVPAVGAFLDDVINELSGHYNPDQGMRFDSDFLFATYQRNRGNGLSIDKHTSAGLIGFAFRLTSGTMVFAADVTRHTGYIVPREKTFTRHESLDYYTRASHSITFAEYVTDLLVPDVQHRHPGMSREQILQQSSLQAIEPFLASNTNLRVATNRDDLILAPGELAYLESTLGSRITVYPAGGHCGNINHAANVTDMVAFLKGEAP